MTEVSPLVTYLESLGAVGIQAAVSVVTRLGLRSQSNESQKETVAGAPSISALSTSDDFKEETNQTNQTNHTSHHSDASKKRKARDEMKADAWSEVETAYLLKHRCKTPPMTWKNLSEVLKRPTDEIKHTYNTECQKRLSTATVSVDEADDASNVDVTATPCSPTPASSSSSATPASSSSSGNTGIPSAKKRRRWP